MTSRFRVATCDAQEPEAEHGCGTEGVRRNVRPVSSAVRAIVAQIGARRRYAVPRMLFNLGALARLYTDLAFTRQPLLLAGLPGVGGAIRRRTIRGIPSHLVWRAPLIAVGFRNRPSALEGYLEIDERFGRRLIHWGLGDANVVFAMYGSGTPFWRFARENGVKVAVDVFITPLWHRIVHQERLAFPDWEPVGPHSERELELAEILSERCLLNADLLLCPSERVRADTAVFWKERLRESGREPAAMVLPYGFDCALVTGPARPVPGRVLFVGGAELRKGIHYLARAARLLGRRGEKYEFRIAGQVSDRVRNHPEARNLHFLGPLSREDVDREYARADVFVLPTLAEGSAESVSEALATGLPVVTTRSAGSHVVDGWSGLIVPERDSEALASAIERIVTDREFRAYLARNAQASARSFTEEKIAPHLLAALEKLVA